MEAGVPQTIVTPRGTLTFNAYTGDYMRLMKIAGADGAQLNREVVSLGQRDGGVVPDGFFDPLYPSFEGDIVAATAPLLTTRRTMADTLRSYLFSLAVADGTWSWTPTGGSALQRVCRLHMAPQIDQGQRLDHFQFALVCADPLAYGTVLNTSADITVNGAAVAVNNTGNAPSKPIIRIFGAVTNPVVINNLTGEKVQFSNLVIANGDSVDVDCAALTAILASTSAQVVGGLNRTTSSFWALQPGSQNIQATGTSPSGSVKVRILWRHAWVA